MSEEAGPSFDADFDGQRLSLHPREVTAWLETGRTRGPLYTEMELSGRCNCRCSFCGVDHLVNQTRDELPIGDARRILDELASIGNRSVMFCGHGEPLLHPDAAGIIDYGARAMSASVTTNGLLLDEARLPLIDRLRWIRFSINAGDDATYAAIHGCGEGAFERVIANLARAVARKRSRGLPLTIGTQLVLLDENAASTTALARRLKEVGVDYFSVKPYSQHPLSKNRQEIDYARHASLAEEVTALADPDFTVIFRARAMARAGRQKDYARCYGTAFLSFISAGGDVWECNVFAGDDRFWTGNALEESLSAIWTGRRRREVLSFIENGLEIDTCRDLCRMDACNRYLWRLRHPQAHDDFI